VKIPHIVAAAAGWFCLCLGRWVGHGLGSLLVLAAVAGLFYLCFVWVVYARRDEDCTVACVHQGSVPLNLRSNAI